METLSISIIQYNYGPIHLKLTGNCVYIEMLFAQQMIFLGISETLKYTICVTEQTHIIDSCHLYQHPSCGLDTGDFLNIFEKGQIFQSKWRSLPQKVHNLSALNFVYMI